MEKVGPMRTAYQSTAAPFDSWLEPTKQKGPAIYRKALIHKEFGWWA